MGGVSVRCDGSVTAVDVPSLESRLTEITSDAVGFARKLEDVQKGSSGPEVNLHQVRCLLACLAVLLALFW